MCTQNILYCSAWLKAKTLETKCKQRIAIKIDERNTNYRNSCQPICPHRKEALHHHFQAQLLSPRQKIMTTLLRFKEIAIFFSQKLAVQMKIFITRPISN
jgi:hypothetical protein